MGIVQLALLILCCVSLAACSRDRTLTTSSPEALAAYQAGVTHFEKFYYAEAIASLKHAVVLDTSFAMGWARLATVTAVSGDDDAARAAMGHAERLAPSATERERLYISMWRRDLLYDAAGAAATADTLIQKYPGEREAYVFRGKHAEMRADYGMAIKYYQKACDIDTGYAPAVMMLGYAYSTIGDQEKAVAQMERYIHLAPDAADPRASYADLLLRVGRYDEALVQYRKSLELKPDYWYSVREIGHIDLILGRLADAEKQYHKALRLLPASSKREAEHTVTDGAIALRRGSDEQAVALFRSALDIDTLNGGAAAGLVYALSKVKRFKEAEEVAGRIKQEYERRNLIGSSMMLEFFLMKSRLSLAEGDIGQASAFCDSAREYSSPLSRSAVYRQLAEIYLADKAYESALDACEEALRVNPNNPDALLVLMKVYYGKGERQMTSEIGGRLLRLWKNADLDFREASEVRRMLGGTRETQPARPLPPV
jgi:tetratricopeptide (TPR) repeat protein